MTDLSDELAKQNPWNPYANINTEVSWDVWNAGALAGLATQTQRVRELKFEIGELRAAIDPYDVSDEMLADDGEWRPIGKRGAELAKAQEGEG